MDRPVLIMGLQQGLSKVEALAIGDRVQRPHLAGGGLAAVVLHGAVANMG